MTYTMKLTNHDRRILWAAAGKRWRRFVKQLVLTYLLPLACIFCILFFLNFIEYYSRHSRHAVKDGIIGRYLIPQTLEEIELYAVLTIPIYFIITLANLFSIFRFIIPIHYDQLRNIKKIKPFLPEPYTPELTNDYFIKTNLPEIQFIKVDYSTYISMNYSKEMTAEFSLSTNTLLGIKTLEGTPIEYSSIQ